MNSTLLHCLFEFRYGNRLSKFRTQVKNTLIGVPVDDIIETSNHFGS